MNECDLALWSPLLAFDGLLTDDFLRTGLIHAGRFSSPSGRWLVSSGMPVTIHKFISIPFPSSLYKSEETNDHSHRQNSSIRSPDLSPHTYRPLNLLNKPTHDLSASIADGIKCSRPQRQFGRAGFASEGASPCRPQSHLQFSSTATSVRPAWVSWWMTWTPSGGGLACIRRR